MGRAETVDPEMGGGLEVSEEATVLVRLRVQPLPDEARPHGTALLRQRVQGRLTDHHVHWCRDGTGETLRTLRAADLPVCGLPRRIVPTRVRVLPNTCPTYPHTLDWCQPTNLKDFVHKVRAGVQAELRAGRDGSRQKLREGLHALHLVEVALQ